MLDVKGLSLLLSWFRFLCCLIWCHLPWVSILYRTQNISLASSTEDFLVRLPVPIKSSPSLEKSTPSTPPSDDGWHGHAATFDSSPLSNMVSDNSLDPFLVDYLPQPSQMEVDNPLLLEDNPMPFIKVFVLAVKTLFMLIHIKVYPFKHRQWLIY